MILAVSGWRFWTDRVFVTSHLDYYRQHYGPSLHVRVGDADGVDKFTRDWLFQCEQQGSPVTYQVYRAEVGRYGWPAAGPVRNGKMLRGQHPDDAHSGVLAEELLAFPQPGVKMRSPGSGTTGCLIEAHSIGITVRIPGYQVGV